MTVAQLTRSERCAVSSSGASTHIDMWLGSGKRRQHCKPDSQRTTERGATWRHLALRAEPPHELEARILIPRGLKPIARAEDRPPAIGEDLADCDGRKRPGSALRARLAQRTARGALLLHVTSYAQCSVHGMHRERRISDSCSYAIAVARLKSKSDELDAEGMDDAAYGAARSRRHWWE